MISTDLSTALKLDFIGKKRFFYNINNQNFSTEKKKIPFFSKIVEKADKNKTKNFKTNDFPQFSNTEKTAFQHCKSHFAQAEKTWYYWKNQLSHSINSH